MSCTRIHLWQLMFIANERMLVNRILKCSHELASCELNAWSSVTLSAGAPLLSEFYDWLNTSSWLMCREPDNQQTPDSFKQISGSVTTCTTVSYPAPEASNHVNTEAPSFCETAQETPSLERINVSFSSVDYNTDTVNSEGDFITSKSAQLEVKDMGAINEFSDSLGLVTEEGVEKEDTVISQNISKNDHVDFEADEQVTLNVVGEKTTDVVMGVEKSLPNAILGDDLLCSRQSEVDSEKVEREFHPAGASPTSMGEVSASEAQMTPLSIGSESAQASQAIEDSPVANGALQCEIAEEGVDVGNEINEVDELQVEKADAAKALELKMVEVIMRSPELEVAESHIDGTLNPSPDYPMNVREQEDGDRGKEIMNELSEDDKFTELFQPVVQLPEHLEGGNGFLGGTFDVEDLSNGQASGDLHQERDANTQSLHSKELEDPRSLRVTPNKGVDYTQQSGNDKGDGSMDRQDSGVATPSAATSAQSQSSGLKVSAIIYNVILYC